jgi:uncharacterized OsmC-like protein
MQPLFSLREFLLRKREAIAALRRKLTADPAPAPLRVQGSVAAGSGLRTLRVRGHSLISDSGPALGGYDSGPNAPELLLAAMASCIVHSTLMLAAERGLALDDVSVDVSAEIDYRGTLGVADAPVAPTGFRYELHYRGEVDAAAMAQLQRDLVQVCPVLQALTQPQTLHGSVSRA